MIVGNFLEMMNEPLSFKKPNNSYVKTRLDFPGKPIHILAYFSRLFNKQAKINF